MLHSLYDTMRASGVASATAARELEAMLHGWETRAKRAEASAAYWRGQFQAIAFIAFLLTLVAIALTVITLAYALGVV